jgi:hypothetical protein
MKGNRRRGAGRVASVLAERAHSEGARSMRAVEATPSSPREELAS